MNSPLNSAAEDSGKNNYTLMQLIHSQGAEDSGDSETHKRKARHISGKRPKKPSPKKRKPLAPRHQVATGKLLHSWELRLVRKQEGNLGKVRNVVYDDPNMAALSFNKVNSQN